MGVSVRNASESDISVLIAMGRALHAESPRYARLRFNADKVESLIRSMVTSTIVTSAPGGVFIAEKSGIVIGMLGAFIHSPFFSDDKIASDYTFYVVPEHRRRGRAAVALIREFERWAYAAGAVDIVPGTSTMIDADSTASFYGKLGYERYGYTFIKRLR